MAPKLRWSKTWENAALQAKKAVSCISRYQKTFGFFPPQDMFKLFDSIVKPILCYGADVWGYQYVEKIEKVHIKFCKQYCLLSQNTADFFALGECGRLPLCITYIPQCIKYWLKILSMSEDRYPKQCYQLLYRLDEAGRKTWASNFRLLLFQYGFGHAWISQGVGDSDNLIRQFTERIKDCYKQNWYEKFNSSRKADSYKCYKTRLNTERYLSIDMPYTLRKTLARFRCSSHDLQIEKGRHMNIDRDLRYCNLCCTKGMFVIETEFHFLLECETFDDLRLNTFEQDVLRLRNIVTFNRIMSSNDDKLIYKK